MKSFVPSVAVLVVLSTGSATAQEVVDKPQDVVVTADRAVTATKTDTPIVETPQSISVVTEALYRDRGALNVQETLRYSAGVTGEAYGLDTRGDATVIRGLSPVQFLDGMRSFYTYAPFARLAVDTLARVEVLRGPSSVLYGQASNGGIINSVSKTPDFSRFGGTARIEYGSWDRKQGVIDVNGPLNASGTLAARVVGVVRDAGQQTRHLHDDRVLIAPSIAWRPGDDTQVTLIGVAQRDTSASSQQFLPLVASLLAPSPDRAIDNRTFLGDANYDTLRQRRASVTVIADHRFSSLLSVSARVRYIDAKATFRQLYPDVYSDPANPFIDGTATTGRRVNRFAYQTMPHGRILTSDANAKLEFATGPFTHELLAGIDYSNYFERTWTASGNSTPIDIYNPVSSGVTVLPYTLLPEQLNTQIGFYVQDQIRFRDRLTLVVGARRDRARSDTRGVETRVDEAWTFKAGLIGDIGGGVSPYVSYSEAFQPIPGFDRNGKALVPTRGRQFEGGVKWQPRHGVLLTAAYYDVIESNRPTNDPLDPINVFQTGKIASRGVEVEAAVSLPGDFDLTAAYSYNDAKVAESLFAPEVGLRLSDVPRHMASAWGVKSLRVGGDAVLRIGGGVRYVGETLSTGVASSLKTPGYTLVDGLAAIDWNRWTLAINATNLFDKAYYAPCRAFGDCFTGNRRSVVGSLSMRF